MTKPLAALLSTAVLLGLPGLDADLRAAPKPAARAPMTIAFGGTDYAHRWSKDGQNEFTPAGDEDLSHWKDMITINVHEGVGSGEQLAELANRVLGNYQAHGKVLRTDSRPRTKDAEAEHFASVVMGGAGLREVVFARILLVEKKGVVVVRSRRFYGADVSPAMLAWLGENGANVEKTLMAWAGMPRLAAVRALPQSEK